MKLNGKKPEPHVVWCVLPRPDRELSFRCEAILDYSEFEALCPAPVPPATVTKNGKQANLKDTTYLTQVAARAAKQVLWMLLKSIEHTPGLEWETVDRNKPETWSKLEEELKDSGLNDYEIKRLANCIYQANALNEAVIEEARQAFLQRQVDEQDTTGQSNTALSLQSGDPASV